MVRAGSGVWQGKEMSLGDSARLRCFQLWLALPSDRENSSLEGRYFEAKDMLSAGSAHVIVGKYDNVRSPVPAPDGINYLLVTLQAGENWAYTPPKGHSIGWLAIANGALDAGDAISGDEMVIFESEETPIVLQATGSENTVFVLGSAVPHLGHYSVHT